MLCAFWFAGDYDASLTGLFEYRSATVGDGLLLPILVGVLAAAAISLRAEVVSFRRRLTALGGLVGGLGGAVVIWRWLEDPDPSLNWTWPAPHDFNCAGWAHAVFLCLAAAVVAALLVYVLVSLYARDRRGGDPAFGSWALATWAAVGLVALILRDNQGASGTEAALATTVATVAAALVVAGLALWLEGRRIVRPVLVGVLGAAGTLAYCYHWPPPYPGLTVPLWIPVLALAFALTQPLANNGFRGREALLLSSATAAAGALAVGAQAVVNEQLWAVLAIGSAVTALLIALPIVFASDALRSELREDMLGTTGVVSFVVAALLTASWLAFGEFSKQHALATLSAIELTFDVLVFTLFRSRFRDLVDAEADLAKNVRPPLKREDVEYWRAHGALPRGSEPKSQAAEEGKPGRTTGYGAVPDLYLSLYVFALAALAAVLVLLAAAADPIGLNEVVIGSDPEGDVLLRIGVLFLVVLAGAGMAVAWAIRGSKRRKRDAAPRLGVGVLFGCLVAAAALASIVLLGGEVNQPGLAAAAALVYALLVVESLVFSPVRLQLERIDARRALLIAVTGFAVFAASFWLFSAGVWSAAGPASVWRIGVVSILVLGACLALAALVGVSLAKSGSGQVMTPSGPDVNVALDQVLYALFMFVIGVFPVTAAAQIDAVTGESFGLVSSLMFLPGLFGAFVWVVDNNATHHRAEEGLSDPRPAMWEAADWDSARAEALLGDYKKAMGLHARFQNRGAVAALIAAMIFVAAKLMGV